jgi:hypothetical protein
VPPPDFDPAAALFNNRYLAEVVTAIADHDEPAGFTARQIARRSDIPDGLVRPVLQRLLAAGLIAETGRQGGARGPRYFGVLTETAWPELEQLCRSLLATG